MSVHERVCPEGRTWLAESIPDVVLEVKQAKRGQRVGPVTSKESGDGQHSDSAEQETTQIVKMI